MKKSELKNIIKECVKEVIFEEGVLSGIITEVVQGLGSQSVIRESGKVEASPKTKQRLSETRKQMLDAVASNSYEATKNRFANPELFEGTRPITESNGKSPLSGVAPSDPGVDISNIPGFGNWSSVAGATRK
jgi:hypothetical protein